MAYLLEPVNKPYDPEEPMPTPLGFVAKWGFFKGTDDLKREFKPIPPDLVQQTAHISGDGPMPDFFMLGANYHYVSSRFRSVLDIYAGSAVEYIKVAPNIPASKSPAEAYYFINVLGRSQLIDWQLTQKQGPRRRTDGLRSFVLSGTPDQWAMRTPPPGHPAIWHEVHRTTDSSFYHGSGMRVFVTNALGHALNSAFPGQSRLTLIREMQASA